MLALLIVAHHLSQIVTPQGAPWSVTDFRAWGAIVVGVFFFITGYGLMVSYRRKGAAYLRGFIPHRLAKLLPPFLVAMLGWLLLMKLKYGHDMLAPFATLANGAGPLPNSWFVYAVLLFYLFFYVVARLTPKPRQVIAALWLLSTLYIMALAALGFGEWWYMSIYALNVGFTYAYCERRVKAWLSGDRRRLLLALLALLAVVALPVLPRLLLGRDFHLSWLANYAVPLYVVLCIYVLGMRGGRVLRFLGTISYEIYLVQGCCMRVVTAHQDCWPLFFLDVYAASILSAWLLHEACRLVRWPRGK